LTQQTLGGLKSFFGRRPPFSCSCHTSGTLARFASSELQVLVSTDVAARGVDIPGLRYVVNWDFGTNLAQYVHRIGRTGRQGAQGTAYSYDGGRFPLPRQVSPVGSSLLTAGTLRYTRRRYFSRNLRPLAPAAVSLLKTNEQEVERYMQELADQVLASAAAPPAAAPPAAAPPADDADVDDAPQPSRNPKAPRADACHHEGTLSGSESESGDAAGGRAQRWLSAQLVSPITGLAPTFGGR
jgi:hypothetical protein